MNRGLPKGKAPVAFPENPKLIARGYSLCITPLRLLPLDAIIKAIS